MSGWSRGLSAGRMSAWRVHAYGRGELRLEAARVPALRTPADVLVRVRAASLNPLDVAMMDGYGARIFNTLRKLEGSDVEFPLVLGRDFVGEVEIAGAHSRLRRGDRVWGVVPPHRQGAHAQYVLVRDSSAGPAPRALSDLQAGGALYAALTACSALRVAGLPPGAPPRRRAPRVLLLGLGGVGHAALQLLVYSGAQVVVGCSEDLRETATSLGAVAALDRNASDYDRLLEESGPYEVILDCAGLGGAEAGARRWRFSRYVTLSSPLLREADARGVLAGAARAAAVWLVAEHGAKLPRAAAVLAHMAAAFADQDELVKLQLLSLAMKLSLTQPDTLPVCKYVLSLARYDASYDVRDRARMLRCFVEPAPTSLLARYAAYIFCPDKPKPIVHSNYKERDQYTVGSLSQYIGSAAVGYRPLPSSPRETIAAELRETAVPVSAPVVEEGQKNKSFYSEPDSNVSGSTSSSSSDSSSSEESSDEEEANEVEKKEEKPKESNNYKSSNSGTSDSESDSESSSSENESDDSESSEDDEKDEQKETPKPESEAKDQKNEKSNLELLLELDEVASSLPTMTPTCGGFLSPPSAPSSGVGEVDSITPVGPSLVPSTQTEVISRVTSRGLAVTRRWTRAPHLYSHKMCAVELCLTNHTPDDIENIRVNKKLLTGSRAIHEFAMIPRLGPGSSVTGTLGVDFADSIQPIEFTIISSLGEVQASITPPVGELMRAVTMSPARWDQEQKKLRGMTECSKQAVKLKDEQAICKRVFETANLAAITATGEFLRFAGRMMSSQDLVLLSVKIDDTCTVTANCSNMAIASMLANQIAQAFARN